MLDRRYHPGQAVFPGVGGGRKLRACRRKRGGGWWRPGIDAPLSHFSFCTNGSHFCGEAGIPTIGYGPSLESLAHVRDEYIEISQLTKACRGFASILAELTR